MRESTIKKMAISKIVNVAVCMANQPNQKCVWFCGKPKTQYDLTVFDYNNLYRCVVKGLHRNGYFNVE